MKWVVVSTFVVFSVCSSAHAHGINGHINVTDWAALSPTVPDAWQEAECRNAMVFGSCFPDTGYAINHPYGELMHWPPFVDGLIRHYIRKQAELDDVTKCFIIGLASHGLQDEIFDTFFLPQAAFHDGVDQDVVDPGLDALLVADRVAASRPSVYVPYELLIETLAFDFDVTVTRAQLDEASRRIKIAVIDHFENLAISLADDTRRSLPWASVHYLDENTVGSLLSEVSPTRAYLEATWFRVHGELARQDILSTFGGETFYPNGEGGSRHLAIVLSRGVRVGSISNGLFKRRARDSADESLVAVSPGIWTQNANQYTRVVSIELEADEEPKALELLAPMEWEWVDGTPSGESWFSPLGKAPMIVDTSHEGENVGEPSEAVVHAEGAPSVGSPQSGCHVTNRVAYELSTLALFFLFLGRFKRADCGPRSSIKAKDSV